MLTRNWKLLLQSGIDGRGQDLIDTLGWLLNGESFTPKELRDRLDCTAFHANLILDHLFGTGISSESASFWGTSYPGEPLQPIKLDITEAEKARVVLFMSRLLKS